MNSNHKNHNFLACDWFINVLFSTNSLAKLLSDSLLLDSNKGDFCLRMRGKVKKVFYFATFVNALRERSVFGPAEFNNRTFEGESFFNKSSVSHLKHVTAKSNSK